jgi:hypothetical protein
VSSRLLHLGIRGRLLVADLASGLRTRARSERGQTTVEWIAVMVALVALVTVLWGGDIWHEAGKLVVNTVDAILGTDGDRV